MQPGLPPVHPALRELAATADDRLETDVARLRAERRVLALARAGRGPDVASASEIDGGTWRMRIYIATDDAPRTGLTLALIHGGGWVWGGLDEVDALARSLCVRAGRTVCSVTYRLAPEHRYPAALDDVDAAITWIEQHRAELGIGSRIATVGLSAGGNLAAAVALRRRRTQSPIAAQVLVYPALDPHVTTPSADRFAHVVALSLDRMRWFWQQYLGGHDTADEFAAPGLAHDLSDLPPTYIVLPEVDVLRDEALAFAHRLEAAGVDTSVLSVDGAVHGFLAMGGLVPELQQQTVANIVDWLAKLG